MTFLNYDEMRDARDFAVRQASIISKRNTELVRLARQVLEYAPLDSIDQPPWSTLRAALEDHSTGKK